MLTFDRLWLSPDGHTSPPRAHACLARAKVVSKMRDPDSAVWYRRFARRPQLSSRQMPTASLLVDSGLPRDADMSLDAGDQRAAPATSFAYFFLAFLAAFLAFFFLPPEPPPPGPPGVPNSRVDGKRI